MLQTLVNRTGLTESGRDFLIAALDPMHDSQLKELQGWPDLETASSIVRCVKQTVTVASNQGPTDNWDCHIMQLPWDDAINMSVYHRTTAGGGRVLSAPLTMGSLGGLTIVGLPAGDNLDMTGITGATLGRLLVDPTYSQGSGRLVGMGFEVINSTSQLNVQGQVTVYRQPQSYPNPVTWVTAVSGGVIDSPGFSGHFVRCPPLTQAEAMLIPGTRQWLARDGCYIVQSFVGQDNPPKLVDYIVPVVQVISSTEETFGGPGTNATPLLAPTTGLVGTIPTINVATKIYPMHTGGCIFTGLSASTTLSVTLNYYYETFPTPAEAGILVLATPSAVYDPIALEIFSHCLNSMPVGVPACDNEEGDWFDGIVAIIRNIAPAVIPALAAINPALGGFGAAGLGLMEAYMANQSPKTNPDRPKVVIRGARPQRTMPTKKKNRKTKQVGKKKLVNIEGKIINVGQLSKRQQAEINALVRRR